MVNSQARRLVPGSNLSRLLQALISVSCTRSSASDPLWLRDQANARSAGIIPTTSSRQLDVELMLTSRLQQRAADRPRERSFERAPIPSVPVPKSFDFRAFAEPAGERHVAARHGQAAPKSRAIDDAAIAAA